MTDHMFDNFVKGKLRDHESPVPPGLWEKIAPREGRNPKGGFLAGKLPWVVLFIVVSGLTTAYLVTRNTNTPGNTNAKLNNASTGINDEFKTKEAGALPINNSNTNNSGTGLNTAQENTNATTNINPVSATIQPGSKPGQANDGLIRKQGGDAINFVNNDQSATDIKTSFALNKKQVHTKPTKRTTINSGLLAMQTTVDPKPMVLDDWQFATPLAIGVTSKRDRHTYHGQLKGLDLSGFRVYRIDCPTAGTVRRNDLFIEIFGSPDMTMKSVSAKGNTAYLLKKDSTETQQGGYTAGFRFSKSIGENLLVKAGLQYSQINERFDLRTENERRITTVITIRTVTTPGGSDSTVRDTSTIEQIGYRLQRTYNRYRSIDIPLLLSYEFGGDKLKFGVNAGVIANIYSWYSGQTINDSLVVVPMESKTGMYKTNLGIGLYAGFSIIKPVSRKLDLFLEPYFRYNLSNMTRSTGSTQRYNAAGVSIGIRYKLRGQHQPPK
jgi:hypothetical protein